MSDAFVYMFVVGSGASSGVAVVAGVSYILFKKYLDKPNPGQKKRNRGIV